MELNAWMGAYVKAWTTNDPADIGALFTDDAVYYTAPFRPPWRGRKAIIKGWKGRQDDPDEVTFEWKPLIDTDELAIIQGLTTYPDETFSNLWVIRFDADGRCSEFTEWFMEH